MRRVYQGLGGFLLLLYSYAAFTGWELPGNAKKNVLPRGRAERRRLSELPLLERRQVMSTG